MNKEHIWIYKRNIEILGKIAELDLEHRLGKITLEDFANGVKEIIKKGV